jgi:hypothetical protein
MWNLSLEDIQRAKEELKGRRAAIQARYEDEVKAIDADLVNIEALERAADMFVARHKAEEPEDEAVAALVPAAEPAWSASDAAAEAPASGNWRARLDKNGEAEESPEPEPAAAAPGPKGSSRWRMHIGSRAEGEPA